MLFCLKAVAAETSVDSDNQAKLLLEGRRLLEAKKPAEAIAGSFDKIIAALEASYGGSKKRIYCARYSAESLLYLAIAASQNQDAVVLSSTTWADAYYMKGYALVELGRLQEAKAAYERALTLSPSNSEFLSELGHVYQTEKNWSKALDLYQSAAEAATLVPVKDAQMRELTRALRGQGFVLVELGRLDDAENKYKECLKLTPNDEKAKKEIEYILRMRRAKTSGS